MNYLIVIFLIIYLTMCVLISYNPDIINELIESLTNAFHEYNKNRVTRSI